MQRFKMVIIITSESFQFNFAPLMKLSTLLPWSRPTYNYTSKHTVLSSVSRAMVTLYRLTPNFKKPFVVHKQMMLLSAFHIRLITSCGSLVRGLAHSWTSLKHFYMCADLFNYRLIIFSASYYTSCVIKPQQVCLDRS